MQVAQAAFFDDEAVRLVAAQLDLQLAAPLTGQRPAGQVLGGEAELRKLRDADAEAERRAADAEANQG